ncbi:hypothetical protein OIU85_005674 [Salix viminalis]|uniref:CCHC-type domain-containing protein n=1 Tax=Salix viminalis TaxID=40686 RepID=A0A9Q0STY7_SALVM|nr:hypothetical protein OIU85_005674 [Salix viminalis]
MDTNDKNMEPVIDLGFSLGYSNQCIQRRLKNDSGPGAGANAASSVDMTFVATNALSELVWSPKKGLSLKCADGTFSNKNPPLLWGAGSSDMVSRPDADKAIDKEYFMTPLEESDVSEVAGRDSTSKFVRSYTGLFPLLSEARHKVKLATDDHDEGIKTAVGLPFLQKMEDARNNKAEDIYVPVNLQVDKIYRTRETKFPSLSDETKLDVKQNGPTSKEPTVRIGGVGDASHILQKEIVSASQVRSVEGCESYDTNMQKAPSIGEHFESPSCMEKERENNMETGPYICPLVKLESTAENDFKTLHGENVCDVATEILGSQSAKEVWSSSRQDDEILPIENSCAIKESPTNSRTRRYQMKGKAKALSDGNLNEIMLDVDDDSHESIESCSSVGLFSTGKRQRNFDPHSCAGSKSIKTKIQESPGSSSFVKHDSPFVNWISNMRKGFLKSSEDEAPSLALTLANQKHGHEDHDKNLISCNINQDQGCKTMGFHSLFQSLYCPKTKAQETVALNANTQMEGSKELGLDYKICDTNATPIACHMVTGNMYKQFLQPNEKLNESTSGNGAAPAALTKLISTNIASGQEISRSNSADNKNSCNLATDKEKDGTSSNSFLCKRKRNDAENIDAEQPSEGKATNTSGYKSDPLTSLWVTRLTSKTSGPLSNQDLCHRTGEALDDFTDFMRLKAQWQNHPSSYHDKNIVGAREEEHFIEDPVCMQNYASSAEVSSSINKVNGHHDEKSICKMNSTLTFSRFRNSEAIASVFARRLDALKHIMPSYGTDDSSHVNLTCFFCGIKGHHVRDCPEIIDSELADILRNANSFNGAKEFPCVCIRCFQSNHWAVACPGASSRTRHQAGYGTSLVQECSPNKILLNPRNEDDAKQSDGKDSQLQAADSPTVCSGKLYEASASGKTNMNMKPFEKDTASSSGGKKLKENPVMPLSNFITRQISDVPNGIFDAVKRLRLSRTIILKWTNSHTPPSHLDGFFLRLRLGKWEQGLGGAGYYVACITGVQSQRSKQKFKNSIAVTVGGVKCLVESQYISNHDFTENELMSWWRATLKDGGRIPSEEDLRLKVKEMKILGF